MVVCTEYEDPREAVMCVCTVRQSEKGDVGEEEEEPLKAGGGKALVLDPSEVGKAEEEIQGQKGFYAQLGTGES